MQRTIVALTAIAGVVALSADTISSASAASQTVEADNGGVYRIEDIGHDIHGGAAVIVYGPSAPGDVTAPMQLAFDCRGHMVNQIGMSAPVYVPPRSVAGRIEAIACAGAKRVKTY